MQFKKNKNKSKFPFYLWYYFEKFNSNKILDEEFSEKDMILIIFVNLRMHILKNLSQLIKK